MLINTKIMIKAKIKIKGYMLLLPMLISPVLYIVLISALTLSLSKAISLINDNAQVCILFFITFFIALLFVMIKKVMNFMFYGKW